MNIKNFEICVRGIIIQRNKILICKVKKNKNYFFPGGHVEWGEQAEVALARELKEEIGLGVKKSQFIGTNENFYRQRGKIMHEINIVFEVTLSNNDIEVIEDHLEFRWVDLGSLSEREVYPTAIKISILEWLKNKKIFWSSQGFKK